jgi:hypothetical protein
LKIFLVVIVKKLANTKENTDEIFPLVNCDEFCQQNILLLYPSVNTDKNIPLVYTERNRVTKKGMKKKSKKLQ